MEGTLPALILAKVFSTARDTKRDVRVVDLPFSSILNQCDWRISKAILKTGAAILVQARLAAGLEASALVLPSHGGSKVRIVGRKRTVATKMFRSSKCGMSMVEGTRQFKITPRAWGTEESTKEAISLKKGGRSKANPTAQTNHLRIRWK